MANALSRGSLHCAILQHVVDRGHAPSVAALSRLFAMDSGTIERALRDLADNHGCVLHPNAPALWVIHPFSMAPTAFAVQRDDRIWWGNCAWCSLGIAALLGGQGVAIHTTIGGEGEPVTVHVDRHRVREDLVVHFPIPMARAWDNVIFTCSTMLVFKDEPSVDAWSDRHALPRGDAQPIQTVYEFARSWYGRHLDPGWRKWTISEAREMFRTFGFGGPIWDLPMTDRNF